MASPPTEARCDLIWQLCRRHSWGSPIPGENLVRLALKTSEQGEGRRERLDELLKEPYVEKLPNGFAIKNNPNAQAQAAYRLETTCGYSRLRIEAALSRFKQAGGFEAYDGNDVLAQLDDWD